MHDILLYDMIHIFKYDG